LPLVVGAAVAIVSLLVYGIWRIPLYQASRLSDVSRKERFDVENEARRTLVQLVSGLAIVATIALTLYQTNATQKAANRNLRLATQSQIAQRFDQAIDELKATAGGKKSLAPRIGGIYTLAQMGSDGEIDANSVASILSAYVRAEVPAHGEGGFPKATSGAFSSCAGNNLFYAIPTDVQAAIKGLSSINQRYPVRIDLSKTNLAGASLAAVDLESANLRDAILVDANLHDADLRGAVLVEANLQGACLIRTDLSETLGTEATFDRAHLRDARIDRACLKGAYLSNFTPQQLVEACVDPFDAPSQQERAVQRVCRSIGCV
jgi:hypothetical protein